MRRPGASLNSYASTDEDAIRLEDHGEASPELSTERIVTHYRTNVTGFSFCIGSPMMARCYDKLAELALKREDLREPELERFRANGWDGVTPVTRVSFRFAARRCGISACAIPSADAGRAPRLETRHGLAVRRVEAVLGRVWKRVCRGCVGAPSAATTPSTRATCRPIHAGRCSAVLCSTWPRWRASTSACVAAAAVSRANAGLRALDARPGRAPPQVAPGARAGDRARRSVDRRSRPSYFQRGGDSGCRWPPEGVWPCRGVRAYRRGQ